MSDRAFDDLFSAFYKKLPIEARMHDLAVAYAQHTTPADVTPEEFIKTYKRAMKEMFTAQMTGKLENI